MADLDITKNHMANARLSSSLPISVGQKSVAYDIARMKFVLAGAGYTAAQLNAMTKNDLIFATRQAYPTTFLLPTSIALTGTQTTTVGGTTTFTATATYEDGTTGSINGLAGVAFASSNTGVATVNATTGVVTGVAAGTAAIYVTYRGVTSTPRTVTVS